MNTPATAVRPRTTTNTERSAHEEDLRPRTSRRCIEILETLNDVFNGELFADSDQDHA